MSTTKIPPDDILEGLYKLRIRESEKLKTVLELYDLEIHQKKIVPVMSVYRGNVVVYILSTVKTENTYRIRHKTQGVAKSSHNSKGRSILRHESVPAT